MPNAEQTCFEVLALDSNIRFAGIADLKGSTVFYKYRSDVKPLLSPEEASKSILQAVIKEGMRSTLENKLGECIYSFAKYKNVKRVTLPLRQPTVNGGTPAILMISLEVTTNHDTIVEEKVLPYLAKAQVTI